MEYYWELKYGDFRDPKSLMIPPSAVQSIQRRWDNNQPIHTSQGDVAPSQIKSFEPTDKPFNPPLLIAEVARAFNEPILDDDGDVVCKWVKKTMPTNLYTRYYAMSHGYHKLGDQNGMTIVALFLPVHQIDPTVLQDCTEEEIRRLTNN